MHAVCDPIGWPDDGPGMLSTAAEDDCLSMFDLEQSADLMTVGDSDTIGNIMLLQVRESACV
jgi:hypothetical protein